LFFSTSRLPKVSKIFQIQSKKRGEFAGRKKEIGEENPQKVPSNGNDLLKCFFVSHFYVGKWVGRKCTFCQKFVDKIDVFSAIVRFARLNGAGSFCQLATLPTSHFVNFQSTRRLEKLSFLTCHFSN